MYNVEREWAWALGNAFMNEVSIHGRVFVQLIEVLSSLGRVAWDLPCVPLHPLERSTRHVPWTYAFVLELMHRACDAGERHLRLRTDFTTGVQSAFLLYDHQGGTLVARSAASAPSSRRRGNGGGVRSASSLGRKKRYPDLDGEPPACVFAGSNPSLESPVLVGDRLPTARLPVPPVPPLDSVPTRAPTIGVAARRLTLELGDIRAIPTLTRALGAASDRSWQVESLLRTLATWYLARSDEARDLDAQRESSMSELRHVRSELAGLRDAMATQTGVLERTTADQDRYRTERDSLRGLRVAPAPPASGSVHRATPRDPYESVGYVPPAPAGRPAPVGPEGPWLRHGEVAMPPLDAVEAELPRHPSYCPSRTYGLGTTAPSSDTHR